MKKSEETPYCCTGPAVCKVNLVARFRQPLHGRIHQWCCSNMVVRTAKRAVRESVILYMSVFVLPIKCVVGKFCLASRSSETGLEIEASYRTISLEDRVSPGTHRLISRIILIHVSNSRLFPFDIRIPFALPVGPSNHVTACEYTL